MPWLENWKLIQYITNKMSVQHQKLFINANTLAVNSFADLWFIKLATPLAAQVVPEIISAAPIQNKPILFKNLLPFKIVSLGSHVDDNILALLPKSHLYNVFL